MLYRNVFEEPEKYNFDVDKLGDCTVKNPLTGCEFVPENSRVLFGNDEKILRAMIAENKVLPSFEKAGPRQKIYHDPNWVRAAIVTCGGLCPGINDVIKGLVETLSYGYDVKNIFGIPYGYRGFIPKYQHQPIKLNPDVVDKIHEQGGTILGSSRGQQNIYEICDCLQRYNLNILFTVGGDGTLRGASEIARELKRRQQKICVVGVPKTIDNDLSFIGRSFGFETSVYSTAETLTAAHNEAKGAFRGIGLIKLMGRDSGFIAAYASLANSVVNFCLIPEQTFRLEGNNGLLKALERRFNSGKDHAVIVVAEGAGQELFKGLKERRDDSGNILKNDIGLLLKEKITDHFKKIGLPCSVKYFDPSYSIRSCPAFGTDAILCYELAKNAVHGAMSGRSDMVIGKKGHNYIHVPIEMATSERQKVDINGSLWNSVLMATQQNKYLY